MQSKKQIYVTDIAAGTPVDEIFVLAEKSVGHKRDGNAFLNLSLADRTGTIKGVVWDNVEQIAAAAKAGDFVRVAASASEYRSSLQLVIRSLTAVPRDSVAPDDFLPATPRNVEQMLERLKALTHGMTCEHLKALMSAFWNDDQFMHQFKRAPAAKKMHHAYLGGLLEHTLSMAVLAEKIAGHYTGVDRDLLLAGVVLHDIGKVRELNYDHTIDYTDEGRLLSHIVIGLQMVEAKIGGIDGFPAQKAAMIKHMIVSHHGAREFGSPEPPKTIEAVLLNYIDEIDSRVNAIREFMSADAGSASWTPYHRLLERHFYKGDDNGSDDAPGAKP